ncbi:unnamed protein product [Dovyalis caffra]|uniref:Maturase K n=1 Tax=Dovyalis caffra TaxID=77055 RepID=A0AAV1QWN8_9ROSI|nr:unnamed protein product [Dovyalis caffra]
MDKWWDFNRLELQIFYRLIKEVMHLVVYNYYGEFSRIQDADGIIIKIVTLNHSFTVRSAKGKVNPSIHSTQN